MGLVWQYPFRDAGQGLYTFRVTIGYIVSQVLGYVRVSAASSFDLDGSGASQSVGD